MGGRQQQGPGVKDLIVIILLGPAAWLHWWANRGGVTR
jgi:hypothetical protein